MFFSTGSSPLYSEWAYTAIYIMVSIVRGDGGIDGGLFTVIYQLCLTNLSLQGRFMRGVFPLMKLATLNPK